MVVALLVTNHLLCTKAPWEYSPAVSLPGHTTLMSTLRHTCCTVGIKWQVLRTPVPSTRRREVQEYIPAQLYCTTAGSAWLNLVSQHRQQTQALSPHQARAQFLGKSWDEGLEGYYHEELY